MAEDDNFLSLENDGGWVLMVDGVGRGNVNEKKMSKININIVIWMRGCVVSFRSLTISENDNAIIVFHR